MRVPTAIKLTNCLCARFNVQNYPVSCRNQTTTTRKFRGLDCILCQKAPPGECSKRHHFEFFYRKPTIAPSGKRLRHVLNPTFYGKQTRITLKYSNRYHYFYAASFGNGNAGFFSDYLMPSSVRADSRSKTIYFEELFESLIRLS